jgi:5-formyltetrahydrofolate cyclo-ligase
MIQNKINLRKKFILLRKKKYLKKDKFNFDLIFNLIKKRFYKKKIIIGGYYPANYEVDILDFLQEASKNKFKIVLPYVKSSNIMTFKSWAYKDPLYIGRFGILEPNSSCREITPDLIMVPLVAFDKNMHRIGYGKGYYDRILQKIIKNKKKIISIGIANTSQQCTKIPIEKHDFKLDYIFTERGIINSN